MDRTQCKHPTFHWSAAASFRKRHCAGLKKSKGFFLARQRTLSPFAPNLSPLYRASGGRDFNGARGPKMSEALKQQRQEQGAITPMAKSAPASISSGMNH